MQLIRDNWNMGDYEEFISYLLSLRDEEYWKFHSGLVPNKDGIIGVRTPILRKIAKDIYKGNWREFLSFNGNKYYEETLIFGFVIGNIKVYDKVFLEYVSKYVNYIDNWASCDLFCSSLKLIKKNEDKFYGVIKEYIKSSNPWARRFGFVILLDYYVDKKYLDDIFEVCNRYQMDHYYVKMAIAWLVSICYIKYPQETLVYLGNNKLDKWTFNKAISKICDSYRVSKGDKDILKAMKQ